MRAAGRQRGPRFSLGSVELGKRFSLLGSRTRRKSLAPGDGRSGRNVPTSLDSALANPIAVGNVALVLNPQPV